MKLPTDARRLRCPGGRARDSARRLAPLLPSGFHARILLDASVFFSRHVRAPPGAPCIFGSIQQAGAAAYAPEASFWVSEILRQAIWVGGRGPARQYHAFRVAPGPKMTPIVWLPRFAASPTGTAMLNTPVFARSKRGYVGTGRDAPSFYAWRKHNYARHKGIIWKALGPAVPCVKVRRALSAPRADPTGRRRSHASAQHRGHMNLVGTDVARQHGVLEG